MKITSVSVRRLFSFGQYENMSIGYTADIIDGEDPSEVREALTAKIEAEYAARSNQRSMRAEAATIENYDLPRLRDERDDLQRKIEKMTAFLEAHGVNVNDYELPF